MYLYHRLITACKPCFFFFNGTVYTAAEQYHIKVDGTTQLMSNNGLLHFGLSSSLFTQRLAPSRRVCYWSMAKICLSKFNKLDSTRTGGPGVQFCVRHGSPRVARRKLYTSTSAESDSVSSGSLRPGRVSNRTTVLTVQAWEAHNYCHCSSNSYKDRNAWGNNKHLQPKGSILDKSKGTV